jgi:hypothetical protein
MKPYRIGLLCASLWLSSSLSVGCGVDAPDPVDDGASGIVRGKIEKKLPQVVAVRSDLFNGGWILCTGTYFAERVVVTAGHCQRGDAIPGQTFVYFGNDYLNDVAQLPNIPAPGQPSLWARVETLTPHPEYDRTLNYPDLMILHLDRKLPFDPIPLLREPVTSADKKGEIAGWGGSRALVPDISEVEGAGIKRSGKVKIVGTPTEADFHPDDPNLGILDPAIRANLIKTNGVEPSPNTCAGDSGGPLFVERKGRTYLAGVGFWTGLFCEDYAMFTRIDPFLATFDDAVAHAGTAPITPRLECVAPQADGSFSAYFGYTNDNALTVTIPHGKKNQFAADTAGARPSDFESGNSPFDFSVPFTNGTTLSWKLTPPGGPSTTVTANASSPVCDPADPTFLCAKTCDAELAAECASEGLSRPRCVAGCVLDTEFFTDSGCGPEWNAYNACIAGLSPAAENWACFPGFPPTPQSPTCDPEVYAVLVCLGYY